jgi:spore coat polysaccharide biosynthesis protein SpsF
LDKDYSFLRLTVDEPLDFEVVSAVIKELYGKKGIGFSFQDILCLYKEKPHIFEKNKNIIRNEGYIKSLKKDRIVK